MYIVVEGIDGTGKTELAARLVPPLLRRGHSVSSFREPTDKFLRGEFHRIRPNDPMAAALCYIVDRALIRPRSSGPSMSGTSSSRTARSTRPWPTSPPASPEEPGASSNASRANSPSNRTWCSTSTRPSISR